MIPALKLPGANVAIRFQPANDGQRLGALVRTHSVRVREEGAPVVSASASAPDYFGRSGEVEAIAARDAATGNARHEALLRWLAVEEAARVGLELQPGEVACRIQAFRDRFRLDSTAAMQAFLAHAGITFDKLASFFRAEVIVERMEQICASSISRELDGYRAFLSACVIAPRRASGEEDASLDALITPGPSERALRRQILLGMLAARAMSRRADEAFREATRAAEGRLRARFSLRKGDEATSWLAFAGVDEASFVRRVEELTAIATLAREGAAAIDEGLRLADAVRSVITLPQRAPSAPSLSPA